jgi:predicted DNA-binding protein (MmcQ/YjbR family)
LARLIDHRLTTARTRPIGGGETVTPEDFHAAAMALPAATFDIKWGEDRCYCVGAKMFAGSGSLNNPTPRYSFKASDMAFDLLIEQGLATPSPYLARAKWLVLAGADALPDAEIAAYLAQAHALVVAKLTKKLRQSLGLF